ncbi:MAG: hypothetical protein RMJ56_03730 [Gemmataceae bacterium]|nr:hypothetical protein [Gemmata sp.]MDW8196699.1 hypothetical protein [Gemmataceae bacterium]
MVLIVLVAAAIGGGGGYWLGRQTEAETTRVPVADRLVPTKDRISALGRIQPEGGVVPVYGPPGDRLAQLEPLVPGRVLKVGDKIGELASRKDRLLEVQVAATQLNEARAARAAAERAGQQKIRAAEAELHQTRANKTSDLAALSAKLDYLERQVKAAAKHLQRLQQLNSRLAQINEKVAPEDLEKAELLLAQAEAEWAATKALRTKTETTYDESETAARAKIDAAKAELEEALARVPIPSSEEKLALARQLAERTIITAPISGTVLKVIGREGQPTGIEPILHMADLSQMTIVAEVYESDVTQLAAWTQAGSVMVEATHPALSKPLRGTVRGEQAIARMIARNQIFPLGPREDADRRVVEVIVHLDAASTAAAARFVGLQVTVAFAPP